MTDEWQMFELLVLAFLGASPGTLKARLVVVLWEKKELKNDTENKNDLENNTDWKSENKDLENNTEKKDGYDTENKIDLENKKDENENLGNMEKKNSKIDVKEVVIEEEVKIN